MIFYSPHPFYAERASLQKAWLIVVKSILFNQNGRTAIILFLFTTCHEAYLKNKECI